MVRRLPPLNPLRTFEVAAHCQSFTEAATELGVTQAAVSRQIGVLEGFLRTQLFERSARSIRLTRTGRQLYNDISAAFADIQNAMERILEEQARVRLRTYPTLAVKWLMPIVGEFIDSHPEVDLRIETGVRPDDFSGNEGDIFIQFGAGDWPHVKKHPLFRDELTPVCSPRLLEESGLSGLDAITHHTLLSSKFRSRDWSDWLKFAGGPPLEHQKVLSFESSLLTYQAAISGLGIALGQKGLLRHDLKSGLLTEPCRDTLVRDLHYWVLWSDRTRLSKESQIFVDWLMSHAGEQNDAS
jgi:LysR family glycine cleavage system transcriptional activator